MIQLVKASSQEDDIDDITDEHENGLEQAYLSELTNDIFNGDLRNDIQEKKAMILSKKNIATAIWYPSLNFAEITVMRGNFWKCCGFSMNAKCYLFPEEALYLVEKNLIAIYDENKVYIEFNKFYEAILKIISIPCYLTYCKLKSLDYIVTINQTNLRYRMQR